MTYRLGPHTTADDPSRYRDAAEVERRRPLEPLVRYRRFLQARQLWSEAGEATLTAELEAWIAAAVQRAEAQPAPRPEDLFDHLYASTPPALERQREELLNMLREG